MLVLDSVLPELHHQNVLLFPPGCNARSIPEERTQWEVMVDQFNNYFTDLNLRAGDVVKDIRSSQISRELE